MTEPVPCPRCGSAASGNFCGTCGAPLVARPCAGCNGALAPGAAFCHHCGRATGAPPMSAPAPARRGDATPWIVAAVLSVLSIAVVTYAAVGRGGTEAPAMPNAGNANTATETAVRAPDISNMTPREQFDRLYDRVMSSAQAGDTAAVIRFWPMAAGAYEQLPSADRDADSRFHMADLHLLVDQVPAAMALADTIAASRPASLVASYLRAIAAEYRNDRAGAERARQAFRTAYAAEIRNDLREYSHHRPLLDQFRRAIEGTP